MNTKTKATPIVMSAQEVNALLAGNKTQIRAPVLTDEQVKAGYDWDYGAEGDAAIFYNYAEDGISIEETLLVDCPFGADGDKLWVQEEWRIGAWREIASLVAIDYRASPELTNTPWVQISDDYDDKKFESLWIETTDELDSKGVKPNEDGNYRWPAGQAPLNWRPAETMEDWASRAKPVITNICIERVQDITESDALAMGLSMLSKDDGRTYKYGLADKDGLPGNDDYGWHWSEWSADYKAAFAKHWDSIHGAGAWDRNDWVWAVDVEVVK